MFQIIFNSKYFILITILILFYLILKKVVFSYWQKHKVPHDDYTVPTGIFGMDFFTKKIGFGNVLKNSYLKMKSNPFHGLYFFHFKVLMINDLELIKRILVSDFNKFCDHGIYSNSKLDPLHGHLAFLNGDEWKTLSAKLTPSLSSSKLKHMFPVLKKITKEMIHVLDEDLLNADVFEFKDIFSRYTTDAIFNLAFGINSDCLRNPQNEYHYYGKLYFTSGLLRIFLMLSAPCVLEFLRLPVVDPKVTKFFITLFEDMVNVRRAENIRRKDYLDSLIDLMDHEQLEHHAKEVFGINPEKAAKRLEPLNAAAQAFAFISAGFETSSSVLSFWLYELAMNSDVQVKLQEEIDEFLDKLEDLTIDNLMQLEYFDMTFHEVLRKYPPLGTLDRVCNEDFKIPNSRFIIPKGMKIIISINGIHYDPDIYHEPQKFNPARFSKENIKSRHPYAFLPFGKGPRICIGKRLGILQSKIAMFYMLANYKFSTCEKTPTSIHYAHHPFFQAPRDGIYLKVEKRRDKLVL